MRLLVVWFPGDSLSRAGFEGRDEIEDPLDEALCDSGLGCVSGGGGGNLGANIDVDLYDESDADKVVALVKRTLKDLNAPQETGLTLHGEAEDNKNFFRVWD